MGDNYTGDDGYISITAVEASAEPQIYTSTHRCVSVTFGMGDNVISNLPLNANARCTPENARERNRRLTVSPCENLGILPLFSNGTLAPGR